VAIGETDEGPADDSRPTGAVAGAADLAAAAPDAVSPAEAGDAAAGTDAGAAPVSALLDASVAATTDGAAARPPPVDPALAAEPAFVEIWRPGRPNRDRRPANRDRRPAEPRTEPGPGDLQDKTEATRPAEHRPPRREPQRHPRGDRGDRRDRRDRPRPERRDQQRPVVITAQGNSTANKVADPNSPFAALAALKAQLEARQRDKTQDDQ
jgi:ATP-dependent RNA helicase SUPV3L1/SUV3